MRRLIVSLLFAAALWAQNGPFRPPGPQPSNGNGVQAGPNFGPGAAVIDSQGKLDAASGAAGNCVLVNGTSAPCGSGGASGTVSSVGTNNGLTGGPVTSSGTLGLAPIAAGGMLCNTGTSAQPPAVGNCGISVPESVTGTTAVSATSPLVLNGTTGNLTCPSCGTVTSVGTNNGLVGGTITSSGNLGLANVPAGGMLCNTGTSAQAPTATNCGISVPQSVTGTTAVSASSPLVLNATTGNLTCPTCGSVSGVGSVGLTMPSAFTVANSPLTANGTIAVTYSGTALPITSGGTGLTAVPGSNGQCIINNGGAFGAAACGSGSGLSAIANGDILSNISGSSATPSANTLTATLDAVFGATQGTLLYRNNSSWIALAPGTNGQFLQSLGPSANLQWGSPTGSGTVTSCGMAGSLAYYQATGTTVTCDSRIQDQSGSLAVGVGSSSAGMLSLAPGAQPSPPANQFSITVPASLSQTLAIEPPNSAPANSLPVFPAPGGTGISQWTWVAPSANGQCLMSDASNFSTVAPSYRTCPSGGGGGGGGASTSSQLSDFQTAMTSGTVLTVNPGIYRIGYATYPYAGSATFTLTQNTITAVANDSQSQAVLTLSSGVAGSMHVGDTFYVSGATGSGCGRLNGLQELINVMTATEIVINWNAAGCTYTANSATFGANPAASGTGYIYGDNEGNLTLVMPSTVGLLVNGTAPNGTPAPIVIQSSTPGFGAGSVPLAQFTLSSAGNGNWGSVTDARAFMSTTAILAGAGLITNEAGGIWTLGIDPAVVPELGAGNTWTGANDFSASNSTSPMKVTASAPVTCTVGQFYFNSGNGTAYACTAANTWRALAFQ